VVAAMGIICVSAVDTKAGQPPSGCVAIDSGYVGNFQLIVSDTDSASAVDRSRLGLPLLSKDSVSAVSDSATCARAADAYGRNLDIPDTTTPRQVFVVRLGPTRYVVGDPTVRSGEFALVMVFDSSFTTLFSSFAN